MIIKNEYNEVSMIQSELFNYLLIDVQNILMIHMGLEYVTLYILYPLNAQCIKINFKFFESHPISVWNMKHELRTKLSKRYT